MNISSQTDLPSVLQVGIPPATSERQGVRWKVVVPTPRQLALGEEEELGPDGHGQDGHVERPLRTTKEVEGHLKMPDGRAREVGDLRTRETFGISCKATPGYVAAMRRQQYANVCTSFRHPQRRLAKALGKSRPCSLSGSAH